jgi:hypothetical protein
MGAAAELVKKRWDKTTPEERSQVARDLNEAKYSGMSDVDRKKIGKRLAAARRKKKAARPH